MWPEKYPDGRVKVAVRYAVSTSHDVVALQGRLQRWLDYMKTELGKDLEVTLVRLPYLVASDVHADVVFEGRAGSKLWRDWLVSFVNFKDGGSPRPKYVGFWDLRTGLPNPASLRPVL